MRTIFVTFLFLLAAVEFTATYLVMPLPGSQGLESVGIAWFLYHYRWIIRIILLLPVAYSIRAAFAGRRKWQPILVMIASGVVVYASSYILSAEAMFQPPAELRFPAADNTGLDEDAVVIGISLGDESKAYPVRYIAYHHQVFDSLDGVPVLVTYCSVCRSGRVYEATVNGITEGHLRLVGMTRYNAMFEDAATGSWWMQATGEAVAGPLKGERMKEIPSAQMSLKKWLQLHPGSRIMQPDPASISNYDPEAKFEKGKSSGPLTRRDTASWKAKSWVIGVINNRHARAYSWNDLVMNSVINDTLGGSPVAIVLASDKITFSAFLRPGTSVISVTGDTVRYENRSFDLMGRPMDSSNDALKRIAVYQEHWHSWRQFHGDDRYRNADH